MKRTMRILTLLMLAVVVGTGQTWADALPDLGHIVFDGSEVTDKGEVAFYRDAECENVIAVGSNLTSEALTAVMDGEDIIGYTVYIKAVPNYDYTLGAADNNGVVDFITAEKTTNVIQAPRHSSPDPSIPRPNAIEVKATGERFVYSFTMPANGANATIHVNFPQRTVQQVEYIDADGVLQTGDNRASAYVIDGSETGLGVINTTMWYVVPAGSVSYTSSLQCLGDVNLILADGATMTIGTADSPVSGNSLYNNGGSISIYGQSQKTGKLTVYAETYGVYASGDVTISSCEVEATGTSNDAIYAKTISLTDATVIAEGTNGICANSGALTISGGNVDATGTGDEGRGLYASGLIDISDESFVTAFGNLYGIYSQSNITIDGCTVEATGTNNIGISSGAAIEIQKTNESAPLSVTATGKGKGIEATNSVTVTGGTLGATGTDAEALTAKSVSLTNANVIADGAKGIYASSGDLEISGGSVDATATGGNGLYASDGITVNGGEVTATSSSNDAINAKTISLTDATVIAEGTNGICAGDGDLSISGGNVDATGTGDEGRGLYASGLIDISDESTVTAFGNEYGIYSQSNITIDGCSVEATGTNNIGISSGAAIEIQKTDESAPLSVTATGKDKGIEATNGVTVTGGTLEAYSTDAEALTAKSVSLTDANVIADGAKGIYASNGDLEISGGSVEATATGGNGLYASDGITVNGGEVYATSSSNDAINAKTVSLTDAIVTAEGVNGIYAGDGDLSISGGNVDATGTGDEGRGLYASGLIDISDESTVTAFGNLYGIYSQSNITINGCIVEATGTNNIGISSGAAIEIQKTDESATLLVTATGQNKGIEATNSVTVTGGTLEANSTDAEALTAKSVSLTDADVIAGGTNGIYASNGDLEISGGSVEATATGGNGLYASDGITVNGGEVYATSTSNDAINAKAISLTDATVTAVGTNGIYAGDGDLSISGGNVDATGTGDEGRGLYASGNINISWTDEENDFIDASSYNGTIVVADGQHFRAVSGENTMAFISGTLDKNDADDLDLINSLAGTTLVPFETNGYVVTTVDADLTAGDEPNFTNGDTKFYVYEKDATVTVDYTGEGIVQVTGMDADKFSDAHTFAMPEEDVILTYKGEVLVDNNFTLANSSVDYNAEPQAPGIKYDDVDFAEAYYTLSYTKEGKSTPPSQVQNPGNYVVTLTGKGAYIGEVDINEVFVIMPSSAYATTLFAAGSTNQWMTWCGTEELVTPENVEVYTISGIDNSSVALEDITGSATFGNQEMNVIPAYTPVLIYRAEGNGALVGMFNAEGEGTPGIQTAEGTGCTFYGTTTALSTIPSDNYTAGQSYVLRSGNFVLIDENNGIPANKCWLTLNDTSAPLLGINTNGGTTSLSEELRVKSEEFLSGESVARNATAEGWYSLDGRKFDGKPTQKGLYIYNGKKYVIK